MASKTIKERVHVMIQEHLGVDASKVTDEITFQDLGADSLDQVELTMAAEEEFKINIDDADPDYEKLRTVGDFVKLVEKLTDEKTD